MFEVDDVAGIVGEFDGFFAVGGDVVCGGKMVGFVERVVELGPMELNVGDVEFVLRELCAGKDETPVSVWRDLMFGSLRKETDVTAFGSVRFDIIPKTASERAGKRLALFR